MIFRELGMVAAMAIMLAGIATIILFWSFVPRWFSAWLKKWL